jgi:Glutaredoxin-like domain (DUF836)
VTVDVTLYGRPDCHLCDEARAEIGRRRPGLPPFELSEIDIDADATLLAEFLERIPVVEVDGAIVSELEFDAEAFRGALLSSR